MSNEKVKVYKNVERDKVDVLSAYVPQYKKRGIEPEALKSATPSQIIALKSVPQSPDNPRLRQPAIRQPYAEIADSPVGRGKGPMLNVGNNFEHTWSSVDGDIIDDLEDKDHFYEPRKMIDNNDYVHIPDKVVSMEDVEDIKTHNQLKEILYSKDDNEEVIASIQDDLLPLVSDLEVNSYLLLVNGVAIASSVSKDNLEEVVNSLVFGEHELCDGNPVPIDDIVVLKKVQVKFGIFLG